MFFSVSPNVSEVEIEKELFVSHDEEKNCFIAKQSEFEEFCWWSGWVSIFSKLLERRKIKKMKTRADWLPTFPTISNDPQNSHRHPTSTHLLDHIKNFRLFSRDCIQSSFVFIFTSSLAEINHFTFFFW